MALLLRAITPALSNADCERVQLYGKKKLLFFFLHRKEWIQRVPDLPFYFFLTTCSPLFIKWHPESSASYFNLNTLFN